MMKTLVFANQKGGVGKSALATQLAHYLMRQGHRVLVVDLDHQQNTTQALRLHKTVNTACFVASQIFTSEQSPEPPSGNLVLISADERLSNLERIPDDHGAFATRFRDALKRWDRFDVCIIDTNPNPDIRYAAALICADYVISPVQLNQEAISGISALLGHSRYGIVRIQANLNPRLAFLGILPNMVEHTPFQVANLTQLIAKYGGRMLSQHSPNGLQYGYLWKRTAIPEAQAAGAFIGDMAKSSARQAWREIRPVFDMIIAAMALPAPSMANL